MKTEFLNGADDVSWLKSTALKGVVLPADWSEFSSFVLQGNEDSPHALNLYRSIDPLFTDDYFHVRLINESGAYAGCCEYDGRADLPKGGLLELK